MINSFLSAVQPFRIFRDTLWTHSIGYVSGKGWTTESKQSTTERLRYTQVQIVSQTICQTWYPGQFEEQIMFCAGGNGHDVCPGDSGGGMVVRDVASNRSVVEGVVSFGRKCINKTQGSGYARVNTFVDWIEEQIFNEFTLL